MQVLAQNGKYLQKSTFMLTFLVRVGQIPPGDHLSCFWIPGGIFGRDFWDFRVSSF